MANQPLKIYLKAYRKRARLSQRDIAFLIDVKSRSAVGKHETGEATPTLDCLICYELLFSLCLRTLFDGHHREVEELFRERVNRLLYLLEQRTPNPEIKQKIKALTRILGEEQSVTNTMKYATNRNYRCLMSVAPCPRGFGLAVLEERGLLVDRAVARLGSKTDFEYETRLDAMLAKYQPTLVVLEEGRGKRQNGKAVTRIETTARLASLRNIALLFGTLGEVRRALRLPDDARNHDVAAAVAELFPEVHRHLPTSRKSW